MRSNSRKKNRDNKYVSPPGDAGCQHNLNRDVRVETIHRVHNSVQYYTVIFIFDFAALEPAQ